MVKKRRKLLWSNDVQRPALLHQSAKPHCPDVGCVSSCRHPTVILWHEQPDHTLVVEDILLTFMSFGPPACLRWSLDCLSHYSGTSAMKKIALGKCSASRRTSSSVPV